MRTTELLDGILKKVDQMTKNQMIENSISQGIDFNSFSENSEGHYEFVFDLQGSFPEVINSKYGGISLERLKNRRCFNVPEYEPPLIDELILKAKKTTNKSHSNVALSF